MNKKKMSEKDANDNAYPLENENNCDGAQALPNEEDPPSETLDSLLECNNKKKVNSLELDSCLPPQESSSKKEENPFSFKKFLNQDASQKNKGARKKVFATPPNAVSSDLSDALKFGSNRIPSDSKSRMSASDMSSVLPDFVQDHLIVEQCYLSNNSSNIDINNLNLQNLQDFNLEHKKMHFKLRNDTDSNEHLSEQISPNLPDFTLGASNFQPGKQNVNSTSRLPDFALHTRTNDDNDCESRTNRNVLISNVNETSQPFRQRIQISSSPSVPLDLPSYENDESNQSLTIPFDLTAPTEEHSNSRGRSSNETVSKSLPDFLSDGPIKKELDENLQNVRGVQNGLSSNISPTRTEERLRREIDLLRCQLVDKNRRIERLERELEHMHSTDQRETASLEYALQEVEKNLKQTAKRALNAENLVLRLKQENKTLKSEMSSLRSENVLLKLGSHDSQMSPLQEASNLKIAKELKMAATQAENSLKSLLQGVDNLRVLADSIENSYKFQDANKDFEDFDEGNSASGPAL